MPVGALARRAGADRTARSSWGIPQDRVGKGGVEPPRPSGHTDLNRARLPFRHLPWRSRTLAADRRSPGRGWVVTRCAPRSCGASRVPGRSGMRDPATITGGQRDVDERKGATVGVLQRFERRLEGMVGLAFARIFKGKVHPAEIAKALQREADEQRSVLGEGRVLAPNVYFVRLGKTDYEHLGQWSDQLAGELADMVAEHIDGEGYQIFDKVSVRLERDSDLPTGVFEVSSQVDDPARPSVRDDSRLDEALGASPLNGRPPLPPLPPLRGRGALPRGTAPPPPPPRPPPRGGGPPAPARQAPSFAGRAGPRWGVPPLLVADGPATRHELTTGRNVIGRGTEADIRLPDTGVSRKHVDVILESGKATVEDLGSTNGTLVNGRRISRQVLADGDVIRIGHSVLVYRQDGA